LYNFAQKTQSLWVIAYASALFLAFMSLLAIFKVVSFDSLSLNEINQVLLYSGLLFAIGVGFGLGALESSERRLFWKWSLLWIFLIFIGLFLTVSGIAASFNDPANLFDIQSTYLFAVGVPFLLYGTVFFFGGMNEETRDAFGNLWIIYLLFLVVSLVMGFAGFGLFFATEGGRTSMGPIGWDVATEIAIVFGILSIVPFGYVMGSREGIKEKFHAAWPLWLLLSLAGVVLYVLTAVEVLANVDVIGGAAHREGGLILGLVFQAPGFVFLFGSTEKDDLVKKLDPLSILLVLVGLVLTFASQLVSSLEVSTLGLGIGLVVMGCGLLYKSISLDYSPTSISASPSQARAPVGVSVSAKSGFEVPNDLPVDEKKNYIEMQRKTNENTIVQLTNYAKSNKLSKSFVDRKVQELKATNDQADSLIASIVEQAKRSSRQTLFEQAMGNEPQSSQSAQPSSPARPSSPVPPMGTTTAQTPPMSPPGPPSTPPAPMSPPTPPKSSGPPMPPPSSSGPPKPPSGAPPMPPGSNAPPKPPSGAPPMPPGSSAPPAPPGFGAPAGSPPKPPGMPPMPPGAAPPVPGGAVPPKAPGAPSGDAVGTARSTSIAELRGEMLKELRRLRDIFNEDQK
jgi:hypothetical protein